jgi:hypothetical protein
MNQFSIFIVNASELHLRLPWHLTYPLHLSLDCSLFSNVDYSEFIPLVAAGRGLASLQRKTR